MDNTNILVTGASQGIGFAIVNELLEKGYNVISVSRSVGKLNNIKSKKLVSIFADLTANTDRNDILKKLKQIRDIDIISNAAFCMPSNINNLSYTNLLKHFETNVISPVYLINELLKYHNVKKVLSLSTRAAHIPIESMLAYCTSKSAMHHAINCFNLEYSDIGFANVRPGIVDTPNQNQMKELPIETFPSGNHFFKNAHKEGKLISAKIAAKFIVFIYEKTVKELKSRYWYIGDYNMKDFMGDKI